MVILILFLIFLFLEKITPFIFTANQFFPQYCYYKILDEDNKHIIFNFATIGEKKEYINITLTQKYPDKKIIYYKSYSEMDEYTSYNLSKGKYYLCFIPNTKNEFKISFNFQILEEDENLNNIVTDSQMKELGKKLEKIKYGFKTLENNSNNLMNNKISHLSYLFNYLKQIKWLTFAKVFVVGFGSLFQIYVIKKMFGDDNRMNQIKPGTINNKNEFL